VERSKERAHHVPSATGQDQPPKRSQPQPHSKNLMTQLRNPFLFHSLNSPAQNSFARRQPHQHPQPPFHAAEASYPRRNRPANGTITSTSINNITRVKSVSSNQYTLIKPSTPWPEAPQCSKFPASSGDIYHREGRQLYPDPPDNSIPWIPRREQKSLTNQSTALQACMAFHDPGNSTLRSPASGAGLSTTSAPARHESRGVAKIHQGASRRFSSSTENNSSSSKIGITSAEPTVLSLSPPPSKPRQPLQASFPDKILLPKMELRTLRLAREIAPVYHPHHRMETRSNAAVYIPKSPCHRRAAAHAITNMSSGLG